MGGGGEGGEPWGEGLGKGTGWGKRGGGGAGPPRGEGGTWEREFGVQGGLLRRCLMRGVIGLKKQGEGGEEWEEDRGLMVLFG